MSLVREVVPFTTEEAWLAQRSRDITSTSVSALFGVSPYLSKFELWHRLKGGYMPDAMKSARMNWGNRLESAIARGVFDDQDWSGRAADEYIRLPEVRIGSSFDYRVHAHPDTPTSDSEDDWILECKNVDGLEFRNGWIETDYGLEAPPHIEIQLQHELLCSGLKEGYIAALVGGNRLELLHRHYDEAVGTRILEEAEAFWKSPEPEPDFRVDSQFISRLHQYAEPGKVIDADTELTDLLAQYAEYGRQKRIAEDEQDAAKAKILLRIGDAERVNSEIGTLSAGVVKGAHIEYDRKEYRGFRFSERRKK